MNVLTIEVLRNAVQSVRAPRADERAVHWPNGRICFSAPIDKLIGLVAAGFVEFEEGHFYLTLRAEHELMIRGIRDVGLTL